MTDYSPMPDYSPFVFVCNIKLLSLLFIVVEVTHAQGLRCWWKKKHYRMKTYSVFEFLYDLECA